MKGTDPRRSQKGPRFVLFQLDANEERIPFSYKQLKIDYSRLALFLGVAVAMSCQ